MKLRQSAGLLMAMAIPFLFSGCKDDEPKPASVGFDTAVEEITESDGTITSFHPLMIDDATGRVHNIVLALDKAASGTSVVAVNVSGSATRNSAGTIGDYEMPGVVGTQNITIEKGQTEVIIPVTIFEDYDFEVNDADSLFETIELTISSVISGPVKLGEQTSYKLRILEDDIIWLLQWQADGSGDAGDVDMDLLFHLDGDLVYGSASPGSDYENINIPGGFPPGSYGVSYTYYSGTSPDVDFLAAIFTTAGTVNGDAYSLYDEEALVFEGHYTLDNINEWDEVNPPLVSQTVTKSGINYTALSNIIPHTTGSRANVTPARFNLSRSQILNSVKSIKSFTPRKN